MMVDTKHKNLLVLNGKGKTIAVAPFSKQVEAAMQAN